MNQEMVSSALAELKVLGESVTGSQKFGQLLPVGTTKNWGEKIRDMVEKIEAGLKAQSADEPAKEPGVPATV